MRFQPRPLPLALALLLCASAQANENEEPVPELAPIRISASPLALRQTELATASTVDLVNSASASAPSASSRYTQGMTFLRSRIRPPV